MAVQPPAWSPFTVTGGVPLNRYHVPAARPMQVSVATPVAPAGYRGWMAALWRWRPWSTVKTPPPPAPAPSAPPDQPLTPNVVHFVDRTVVVDLSQIGHQTTIELGRGAHRAVRIERYTLTILIPDPRMADHHTTVHSIPERRLMVIHDHGSAAGTIMGDRKYFLEAQFLTLSQASLGVTLTLADTTVLIGQPRRLALPAEATYDWRTGRIRTALAVLTETATNALRMPDADLLIELHRLADDSLIIRAAPVTETGTPQRHGDLDIILPEEDLDEHTLTPLLSFVAGHLRVFRPAYLPTVHMVIEWLSSTAFANRLDPWVMDATAAARVREEGLIIFLSRGREDSTDGFDWVVRADGTAGILTDRDLMPDARHVPKILLLLPWHGPQQTRTQMERIIERMRFSIERARLSADIRHHLGQIFIGTLTERSQ